MEQSRRVQTPHDDLTYKIIGCAMAVHRKLGPGHREQICQRALQDRLADVELSFESQKLYEVHDGSESDRLLGYYIPDFVIEEKVVVEIKAIQVLDNNHLAQVIGYLAVSGCPIGLLVNFGRCSLEYKRILPPKSLQAHQVNLKWLFIPDWLKEEDRRR
jgi:GxxExxY protein